ncbi:hypothetical protein BGZ83_008672, partial [Gryganskiella cystojenkinii]
MKLTITSAAAALAVLIGSVSAQAPPAGPGLSAACTQYLNSLAQPSNPLYQCRVYTALGFPGITHKNDHDTPKLQKAIVEYCAKPACTQD